MKVIEFSKPVYTFEIDAGQHVSNIAYIEWLEIARLKLLEEAGLPIDEIRSQGVCSGTGQNNHRIQKTAVPRRHRNNHPVVIRTAFHLGRNEL